MADIEPDFKHSFSEINKKLLPVPMTKSEGRKLRKTLYTCMYLEGLFKVQ